MYTNGVRVSELVTKRKDYGLRKGVVLNDTPDPKGNIMVEWDARGYYDPKKVIEQVHPSKLMLEADAINRSNYLEAEFSALESRLKEKLVAAAKLIDEAAEMAEANGETLAKMYNAVSPLVGSMDGAGWNTSSWGC